MLDGILGRGFTAKCKSLIKLTKSRIDVIRRKRRATEKFLKKDIADLLLNGLDINAYGRAEGLVVELTLSSCYGFVEQCCEFVLKHLPAMQKLSGCPEECRMAVSSLMFGAARFSDLPELRDLRQIFQERYGNFMECYVNQEFAANLNFKSSTLENKVWLMQEIASEFSIKWDSNAFKLRMSRSSAVGHDARISNHDKPSHGKDSTQKEVRNDVLLEKNQDLAHDGWRFQNGKEAVVFNRNERDLPSKSTLPGSREVPQKRDGHDNPGRHEVTVEKSDRGYWKEGSMLKPIGQPSPYKTVEQLKGGSKLYNSRGQTTPPRENQVNMLKPTGHPSQKKKVEQFEGGSKLHYSRGNITPPRENLGSMLKQIGHTSQPKTVEQFEGGSKLHNGRGSITPPRENESSVLKPIEQPSQQKTVEQFEGGSKLPNNSWGNTTPLRENQDITLKPFERSSQKKIVEKFEGCSKLQDSWGNTTPLRENLDTETARKPSGPAGSHLKSNALEPFAVNHVGHPATNKSERKIQRHETPTLQPCHSNVIPPPYVKQPNSKQQNSTRGANLISSLTDSGGLSTYHSAHEKPDTASVTERIQIGLESSDQDWQGNRHERLSKQSREKEISFRQDAEEVPVVKSRPMRRRHSRSRPPSYYDASNEESGLQRKSRSRSRRRDESRRGPQTMFDDERYQNAEEERIIDKLLIHYSKKPSVLVPEKLKRKSKIHHTHLMDDLTKELQQNGRGDGFDETPEMVSRASRSFSLPREQQREVEVKKVFNRAATFEPVRSHEARHVHPKLPDYDDLAARIAALRG